MVEADERKSLRTWSAIDATGKVSCLVTTFCFQKIRGKWRAECEKLRRRHCLFWPSRKELYNEPPDDLKGCRGSNYITAFEKEKEKTEAG
jgi:hypothetical protein